MTRCDHCKAVAQVCECVAGALCSDCFAGWEFETEPERRVTRREWERDRYEDEVREDFEAGAL